MAPTSAEIEQLLTSRPIHEHIKSDNPGILNFGGLENIFADNIHIEIPGLDVDIHGLEQFESDSVHPDIPSLTDVINTDLPVEVSAPHVIGGGDDSHAVIIANSKGTTHSGMLRCTREKKLQAHCVWILTGLL